MIDALTSSAAQSNEEGNSNKPCAINSEPVGTTTDYPRNRNLHVVDTDVETAKDTQSSSSFTTKAANQSSKVNTERFSAATATSRGKEKKRTYQDLDDNEELDDSEDESSTSSFTLSIARRNKNDLQ